jgi:thiamine pyrophosphokinase
VSLLPLAPVTGGSAGLRWPIEGLSFDPLGRVGASNVATGPVSLRMDGPGMLVVLPREALDAAVAALLAAPPTPEEWAPPRAR